MPRFSYRQDAKNAKVAKKKRACGFLGVLGELGVLAVKKTSRHQLLLRTRKYHSQSNRTCLGV
jgi:hypothetical protein